MRCCREHEGTSGERRAKRAGLESGSEARGAEAGLERGAEMRGEEEGAGRRRVGGGQNEHHFYIIDLGFVEALVF
jgi:hypothetical protein